MSKKMPVRKTRQDKPKRTGAASSATSTSAMSGAPAKSPGSTSSAGADASSPVTDQVKCAVCEQNIVDGKDQALFCEGLCKGWYHRYCAGGSLVHFQWLSLSSKPFFCSDCFQAKTIEELRNTVGTLKDELRNTVGTLKDEIATLRVALEENRNSCNYILLGCLSISTVAYEEVLYLIRNLDVNRISVYMLKATAESISHSLARLFSIDHYLQGSFLPHGN